MTTITVLVPARNEALDIVRCLDGVMAQDCDLADVELLVVDGGSTDATNAIAARHVDGAGFSRVEVISNPTGTTPSNLNVGLAHAKAEVLCRIDARSVVPPSYLRTCAELLEARHDIVVVGGSQHALERDSSRRARAIARALNNRWGMGLSRYRRGAESGPADTVYLGAFRTDDLRDVGGWDERLTTNQDFDLNRRMADRGLIWFASELEVGYLPRADLIGVFRQYHRFGRWKVRYWLLTNDRPQPRQVAIIAAALIAASVGASVTRLRPKRIMLAGAVGAAAALAIEVSGRSDDAARGVSISLLSAATLGAVWSGWLSGVASEALVRGAKRSTPTSAVQLDPE